MKRPHSHWWRQLVYDEPLEYGDMIWNPVLGIWEEYHHSFGHTVYAGHRDVHRRIARPMYAFKMREIIDNSPILHKRVIT